MSTTVTQKGSTLTTATNQTKTLETAGKQMEDDITITDVTHNTYNAFISSGSGSSTICYVQYNGTKYYTLRDTFNYDNGDSLLCYLGSSSGNNGIYVNDEMVAGGTTAAVTYTFILPNENILISLTNSTAGKKIEIEYPVLPSSYTDADTTSY